MFGRKVLFPALAVVLLLFSCEYQDKFEATLRGTPVPLVASTGSIEAGIGSSKPLEPFTHAFLRDGSLHLVVRTWFYRRNEFAQPYLSVDSQRNGVLHIEVKPNFSLVANKCEFLRQFEVAMPAAQWTTLTTLRIFNHDVDQQVTALAVADATYMRKLFGDSKENVSLASLEGTKGGC